jgi:hypothetical protein
MKTAEPTPRTAAKPRPHRFGPGDLLCFSLFISALPLTFACQEQVTTLEACERYVDAHAACIERAFSAPEHVDDVEFTLRALETTCDAEREGDRTQNTHWLRVKTRWFLCMAQAAERATCDDPASAEAVGEEMRACRF